MRALCKNPLEREIYFHRRLSSISILLFESANSTEKVTHSIAFIQLKRFAHLELLKALVE